MRDVMTRIWLFDICAFAVFFLLALPGAVLSSDDYFALVTGFPTLDFETGRSVAITSLADVPRVLSTLYSEFSGRLLLHCLVQLYLRVLGYRALAVTVAVLSVVCVSLIARIAAPEGRPDIGKRLAAMVAMLCVLPFFGMIDVWFGNVSYALNYVVPGTAMLLTCYIWQRLSAGRRICAGWLVAWGIVGGSLQEGFSMAVAAAMAWEAVHPARMNRGKWWLAGAWLAGTLIVSCSPANFSHAACVMEGDLSYLHLRVLDLYTVNECLIPLLVALIFAGVLMIVRGTRVEARRALLAVGFCIAAGGANLLFCLAVVPFRGYPRPLMPLGLMLSVVITALLCVALRNAGMRCKNLLFAAVSLGVVAVAVVGYMRGMKAQRGYRELIEQFNESVDGTVNLPDSLPTDLWPYGESFPDPRKKDFFAVSDGYKMSWYYTQGQKQLRFMPEKDALSRAKAVARSGDVTVYSLPGAWWILVEGAPEGAELVATDFVPHRPLARIKARLTGKVGYTVRLDRDVEEIDGKMMLLAVKPDYLDLREIVLASGDSIILRCHLSD